MVPLAATKPYKLRQDRAFQALYAFANLTPASGPCAIEGPAFADGIVSWLAQFELLAGLAGLVQIEDFVVPGTTPAVYSVGAAMPRVREGVPGPLGREIQTLYLAAHRHARRIHWSAQPWNGRSPFVAVESVTEGGLRPSVQGIDGWQVVAIVVAGVAYIAATAAYAWYSAETAKKVIEVQASDLRHTRSLSALAAEVQSAKATGQPLDPAVASAIAEIEKAATVESVSPAGNPWLVPGIIAGAGLVLGSVGGFALRDRVQNTAKVSR